MAFDPRVTYTNVIARFGALAVWGTIAAVIVGIVFLSYTGCESGCSAWRDSRSDAKHEEYKAKDEALQRQIDVLQGRDAELSRQLTEAELRHQQAMGDLQEKLNAVEQAAERSKQTRTVYRDARRGRIPNATKPVSDDELRDLTNP